ncbi:MAG: hypothetical protein PHR26_01740 [Candidatus ainarchaeum sp.]|nr:hypothetical protein [Candidatus ainarchaeum sp.]MDD3975701.1 hypothetical protein [Candidatus ainarchaeum sp.]
MKNNLKLSLLVIIALVIGIIVGFLINDLTISGSANNIISQPISIANPFSLDEESPYNSAFYNWCINGCKDNFEICIDSGSSVSSCNYNMQACQASCQGAANYLYNYYVN